MNLSAGPCSKRISSFSLSSSSSRSWLQKRRLKALTSGLWWSAGHGYRLLNQYHLSYRGFWTKPGARYVKSLRYYLALNPSWLMSKSTPKSSRRFTTLKILTLKHGLANGKMLQTSKEFSSSESSGPTNSLIRFKKLSVMKLEDNTSNHHHLTSNKLTKTVIAILHWFSFWVQVLILVSKLPTLQTKLDLRTALHHFHWVKVKDNWPKKQLSWQWLKENGFCCKTATWPHHSCPNCKEFSKMRHKSTEISESGWHQCLQMSSQSQFWWKESKWLTNLQEVWRTT